MDSNKPFAAMREPAWVPELNSRSPHSSFSMRLARRLSLIFHFSQLKKVTIFAPELEPPALSEPPVRSQRALQSKSGGRVTFGGLQEQCTVTTLPGPTSGTDCWPVAASGCAGEAAFDGTDAGAEAESDIRATAQINAIILASILSTSHCL